MSKFSKIVAIEDGGDWYDASVDYLVLKEEQDIDRLWEEYKGQGKYRGTKLSFPEWLIEKGYAREADQMSDIQTIHV